MDPLSSILNLTNTISNVISEGKRIDLSSRALDLRQQAFQGELKYNYDRLKFEKDRIDKLQDLQINLPLYQTRALMNAGYRINPYSNGHQLYQDDQLNAMNHSYYSFYRRMD